MPSERADRLTGGHSFISSRNASSERPVSLATRSCRKLLRLCWSRVSIALGRGA
jgi:hypothetical protein